MSIHPSVHSVFSPIGAPSTIERRNTTRLARILLMVWGNLYRYYIDKSITFADLHSAWYSRLRNPVRIYPYLSKVLKIKAFMYTVL